MKEQLQKIFLNVLKYNGNFEEITPDKVEKWDSLSHLNFVLALEEEFGVNFSPDEIKELHTDYIAIVSFLESKLKQNG